MNRVVYIVCHCNSTKRVQICHLLYRAPANAGACTMCVCFVLPLLQPLVIVCVVGQRLFVVGLASECSATLAGARQDW